MPKKQGKGDLADYLKSAGTSMEIKASDTFVDMSYGRTLDLWQVRRIAEHFTWLGFGRPVASARKDGRYALLDGQHRIRAAQKVYGDDVLIPVVTHFDLTPQQEAAGWDDLNNFKARKPFEKLRAAYAADKPDAVQLVDFMRRSGIRIYGIDTEAASDKNAFMAVNLAVKYQKRDWDTFKKTIETLKTVWEEQPAWLSSPPIQGVFRILYAYKAEVDYGRLVDVLARRLPSHLVREANNIRGAITAVTPETAAARTVLVWYNNRLTQRKRLDPVRVGI